MNQILYNASRRRAKWLITILLVLIIAVGLLSTIFALQNKDNEAILKNVFASSVDVGEVTKEEAEVLIKNSLDKYKNREVTLILNKQEYRVTADELGFTVSNLYTVIDEAYNYGREGNLIKDNYTILLSNFKNKEIELDYTLSGSAYDDYLEKIIALNDSIVKDDYYTLSGDNLIIVKGQDGSKIDSETLKENIILAIKNDIREVEIPIINSESKRVDLDRIYEEILVAPKNAEIISGDKFEVVAEVAGKAFDLEKAKEDYRNHQGSGEIIVPLTEVLPAITIGNLDTQLFTNTISTFTTTYDVNDSNRVKNLTTAAERCNGTVVYPGEEFSFHKTIGTRTTANGYAVANSFAGGRVVTSVGGGICQISSNLYNVVLKANMEILERKAHGMIVAYAEPSLDATIAEGSIDFRFKNTRKYPIKIVAEVKNGSATVSIMGLKDKDEPTIELKSVVLETLPYSTIKQNDATMMEGTTKVIQKPANGYVSEAYKIVKDSYGNIISETLIHKDRYIPTNEIIKVGTKVNKPVTPVTPAEPSTPAEPEQPEIPEEPDRDLPPGWDSPESPYGR